MVRIDISLITASNVLGRQDRINTDADRNEGAAVRIHRIRERAAWAAQCAGDLLAPGRGESTRPNPAAAPARRWAPHARGAEASLSPLA